jgi:hypothetical protein
MANTFSISIDGKWLLNTIDIKTFRDLKLKLVLMFKKGIMITVGEMNAIDDDQITHEHMNKKIKGIIFEKITYLKYNESKIYYYCRVCRKTGSDEYGLIKLNHGNKCRKIKSRNKTQNQNMKEQNIEENSINKPCNENKN